MQALVRKDADDDSPIFDGGDDLRERATVWPVRKSGSRSVSRRKPRAHCATYR